MLSEIPLILNPNDAEDLQETYPTLVDFYRAGLRSYLGCRLITNDRVIGTLQLSSSMAGVYGHYESQLLERIANQVAGSIASAITLRAERDPVSQLEALYEVAAINARPMDFEAKAQGIVDRLVQIADADLAVLRRADENEDDLDLVAIAGTRAIRFEPTLKISDQHSVSSEAFREGRIFLNNDYQIFPEANVAIQMQGVQSSLVMPIRSGIRKLGLLSVSSKTANHFNDERVALLTACADEIGFVFDSAELTDILQESRGEMALADEITNIITSTTNIEEVGEKFTTELKKLVDFDHAEFAIVDRQASTITIRYHLSPAAPGQEIGRVFPLDRSGNLAALADGIPSFRADLLRDARHSRAEQNLARGVRSSAVVPLMAQGRLVVSITLHSHRPGAYGPREQAIILRLANQIAPAVENAMLVERELDSQRVQRRLAERLAARKEEMALVDCIVGIMTESAQIDDVYLYFSDELKKLIDFDRIVINVIDHKTSSFSARFVAGTRVAGREQAAVHKIRGTIVESLIKSARPIVREDIRDENLAVTDHLYIEVGLKANMAIPLISNFGIIATLHVHSKQFAAFGYREQVILERLAVQITPAIANALLSDALVQGEAQSRALLEMTSDAIITIEEAWLIKSFNPSAEAMFGYTAHEAIGRNVSVLMPGSLKDGHDENISRYLPTGEARIVGGSGRVLEGRHKDDATIPMELWLGVVESEGGRGFIGIIRRLDQRAPTWASELHQARNGRSSNATLPRLTNREIEALHILANGGRNKDIAAEMTVSLRTVKFHIENLYEKLDVRTRAGLIRVATQRGLLTAYKP